ncbi:MAG: ABC transporter ATP-binding protein [Pseudomonadota bacterium]
MKAIEFSHVAKSYDGRTVLEDVSWSLESGSITGLLGKNGAGKSTLMQILLGLAPADGGSVTIKGDRVSSMSPGVRRKIGYVPQTMESFDWMTAGRSIEFVRSFYGDQWDDNLCERLLGEWQVPVDTHVSQLSNGEKQKLAIILAIGHGPDLLVLDEPAASLDPVARRSLLREVVTLNAERGQTVLFSTHIISDLERVAGDLLILDNGLFSYAGELEQLKEQVLRISCGTPFTESIPEVSDRVLSMEPGHQVFTVRDWQPALTRRLEESVGNVSLQSMGLEEIYIALTSGSAGAMT